MLASSRLPCPPRLLALGCLASVAQGALLGGAAARRWEALQREGSRAHNPLHAVPKHPDWYPKPAYVVEEKRCLSRFYEAVQSLHGGTATDIIIGANDGKRFDPAMYMDYWTNVPDHTKIFIEPVPPLFQRLQNNTAHLGHVVALNRAVVRTKSQGDALVLYCWDIDMVEEAVQRGSKPLPKEARQPSDYWTALCSQERREVLVASNALDTPEFKALSAEDQERVRLEVEGHIKEYRVPASTLTEIAQEHNIRNAGYVQIDVEGMDNEIVQSLPLGQNGFLPKVILYENHHGDVVKPYLQSHGYEVCCCLQHQGNNMIAVLDSPSWVQERRTCEQGLRNSLESTFGEEGIDIVIGARDGTVAAIWPAPWFNYWANVPEHRKLFVEASPELAAVLPANLAKASMHDAAIGNFTIVPKAVRGAGAEGQADVFCWSPRAIGEGSAGRRPLPAEVRQPREEWKYLCAASKQRALDLARVLQTPLFAALPAEDRARVQAEVEKHLVRHAVESASLEEVLAAGGPWSRVRYLQLHPSEPVQELLPALPLGREGFLPEVITYGKEGSEDVREGLKSHGYHVCCCVEHGGSSMVATLSKPSKGSGM